MTDFCQNDGITTLQKLKERPIAEIEKRSRNTRANANLCCCCRHW